MDVGAVVDVMPFDLANRKKSLCFTRTVAQYASNTRSLRGYNDSCIIINTLTVQYIGPKS